MTAQAFSAKTNTTRRGGLYRTVRKQPFDTRFFGGA